MTLGHVIVRIIDREYAAGLTYTGCSRVRNEDNLAIITNNKNTHVDEFPTVQRYWVSQ